MTSTNGAQFTATQTHPMTTRFQSALQTIDDFNRKDPRRWVSKNGSEEPYEVAYSKIVSHWVLALCPDAAEEVQLAARAMHIGRWMKPRNNFPLGLNGYLQWREDLKRHHATLIAKLLQPLNYETTIITRIQALICKENPADPENQLLEDALCLVFLEHQLANFIERHEPNKVVDILKKTWGKLSEQGKASALELPYSSKAATLLKEAIHE